MNFVVVSISYTAALSAVSMFEIKINDYEFDPIRYDILDWAQVNS